MIEGPGPEPQKQGSSMARIQVRTREPLAPVLAIKPPMPNYPVIFL